MKAKEIRELTKEELAQKREDLKMELFNLRMQQTTGQLEKPSRIKELRRHVACLETVMTENRAK
ncbi:MAG: 50S ribosomal protein L29 [Spartobacteria bacterium]|nr:50S ribosomal protein L29 [Spartobacteria bacterium]